MRSLAIRAAESAVTVTRGKLQLVPAPVDDDQALMRAAQRGDRSAFTALVNRHLPAVHRFCVKMAGASMGDELMQETFTKLWHARAQYQPSLPVVNYLFSIAANVCRSHLRSTRRGDAFVQLVSTQPALPHPPTADQALEFADELARVNAALLDLPEALREAVVLRFGEELDSEALGRTLGCNASTARSRVFFGLKKLRELLGAS